eukprot:scaffold182046_cov43-Attheya_sp.AAC.2
MRPSSCCRSSCASSLRSLRCVVHGRLCRGPIDIMSSCRSLPRSVRFGALRCGCIDHSSSTHPHPNRAVYFIIDRSYIASAKH